MKRSLFKLLAGVFVLALFSSCTVYQKGITSAPLNAQVNFDMDDLEYLGTVEGRADQSYVLGIPVAGRRFRQGIVYSQRGIIGTLLTNSFNRGTQNAVYDALNQRPDADFVLPFSAEQVRHQMFLGSRVEYYVKAKAFKIKSK